MNAPDLRPLTIGELLDRTFTLYKRHFWLFVALLAPLAAIEVVVGIGVQILTRSEGVLPLLTPGAIDPVSGQQRPPTPNPAALVTYFGAMAAASLILLLRLTISLSATARAANDLLHDRVPSPADFVGLLVTRVGGLMWLMVQVAVRAGLVLVVVVAVPIALAAGLGALLGSGSSLAGAIAALTAVGSMFGALVVMVVMMLRYALAIPAFVAEALTARQAIRRSIALTRGALGRTFVVYLVSTLVIWSGQVIATLPFTAAIMRDSFRGVLPPLWIVIANQLAASAASLALGALAMLPFVLLYYDLRVRKEALDLDAMLAAMPPPAATSPGAATPS